MFEKNGGLYDVIRLKSRSCHKLTDVMPEFLLELTAVVNNLTNYVEKLTDVYYVIKDRK